MNTEAAPKKMVSHPCLFVFAVFGLRSTIAGEVKCNISVDRRNAVLDCHLPCEGPIVITFLKWTKNESTLALYHGSSYTSNRFGFRQPWNPSSQDISLQINNPTKEDSGEYIYTVISTCETLTGSVNLEIPDMKTTSPAQKEWDNGSETLTHNRTDPLKLKGIGTSRHHQVLFVVVILTAVLVLGIFVLWKRKKNPFSCATSETVEPESSLPVETTP
nr:uncharacterized protein LOC111856696 isoform X1 [Paramormyrops kingsleyae]